MATGTEYRSGEGDSLLLQELRNGNRALSDKLDSQTAEINKSISGLKTMLDKLPSRVTETEDGVGKAEDRLDQVDTRVNKLREESDFLLEKVDQLENYNRCNNIHVVGLCEGCEVTDPVKYFANWIPDILGREHFGGPLIIERAHRTLGLHPDPGQRPRHVLIHLLKYQDREKILRVASLRSREDKGPVTHEATSAMFFLDLSPALVKRRKEFDQVKKELRSINIQFALLHPATLRITLPSGQRQIFKSPREAKAFLCKPASRGVKST